MSKFDAHAKERQLVAEATSWDTSAPHEAAPGDIPVIDVGSYLKSGSSEALKEAADSLRTACEQVGFFYLVGHQIDQSLIDQTFRQTLRFHNQPTALKSSVLINGPQATIGGAGYLPLGNRMLPRRETGNSNEAFIIKGDESISVDDNQWLPESELPGFRDAVERYLSAVRSLALNLLPVYAVALNLSPDFFSDAFTHPFWRLRFTHYPPVAAQDDGAATQSESFGIAPHVDTTFFTLLLQDSPGLTIYSAARDAWINAPMLDGAFVVNSGELLKQWSNDRFLSTRHFANNRSMQRSRCSIPLFFNANADYPMECLPSCTSDDNPPKYPTISYRESQAAVQGE